MGLIPALHTFPKTVTDKVIYSADVNENFSDIRTTFNTYAVLKDVAATVTVTHVFTPTQTFTGGWTAGAGCTISTGGLTVSAGGITVTGNSTITGTLGGVTTATITTMAGNVNHTGTPTFAAGLTVTAGTTGLAALTATTASFSGTVTLSAATNKVLVGSTSTTFRNSGDTIDVLQILSAGGGTWKANSGNTVVTVGTAVSIATSGAGDINLNGTLALATNATTGFVTIPTCAGAPTGAAVDQAMVLDTTNGRIYYRYGGAWHYATLT